MIFSKIYLWKMFEKVKFRYIIVEIILICVGVLLATFINSSFRNYQDQKLIRNNLNLAVDNLNENLTTNLHYLNRHKNLLSDNRKLLELIRSRDNRWIENKNELLKLTNQISISNENMGLMNIVNHDINKLNDRRLKLNIIDLLEEMKYNISDINSFNTNINLYSNFIIKHLNQANYLEGSFSNIIDIEKFYSDYVIQNQIDRVLYERQLYLEIIEFGIIPKMNNLVDEIDLFLKNN